MLKIDKIMDLNGYIFQNYSFEVLEDKVKVVNTKEEIVIEINYKSHKIVKLLDKIYKLTELRVTLSQIDEREILTFIQDKGFEKTLWSPIGKAMCDYKMIEDGDRVAVGISGGKDSLTVLNALISCII